MDLVLNFINRHIDIIIIKVTMLTSTFATDENIIRNYLKKRSKEKLIDKNNVKSLLTWNVISVINYIICCVFCFGQIYQVTSLYFTYDVNVSIFPQWMTHLHMPGMTFCSSIAVKYSDLQDYCKFGSNDTNTNTTMSDEEIDELRAKCYQEYLTKVPLHTILSKGLDFDELVRLQNRKCLLDRDHQGFFCKSLKKTFTIKSFYYPNRCWTLFHELQTPNIQSNSENTSIEFGTLQSPYTLGYLTLDAEMSQRPIRPGEVIRVQLNFTESENIFIARRLNNYVYFHTNKAVVKSEYNRIVIRKGRSISSQLSIDNYILLPTPYSTHCFNYTKMLIDKGLDPYNLKHPYYQPLSSQDCLSGCMALSAAKKCNCWPPEVPFVETDDMSSFKDITDKPLCMWDNLHNFTFCYSSSAPNCYKKCHLNCKIAFFRASVASDSRWPAKDAPKEFGKFSKCCGLFSAKYVGEIELTTLYEPKYSFIEILSTVGSTVGAWFGYCCIDVIALRKYLVNSWIKFQGKRKNSIENNYSFSTSPYNKLYFNSNDNSSANSLMKRRRRLPVLYNSPLTVHDQIQANLSLFLQQIRDKEYLMKQIPWYMNRKDPLVQYTYIRQK